MKVELKTYTHAFQNEWDDFVENKSINGTFLHTRKFYNHNVINKDDDNSFMFFAGNKLIGVVPFNLLTNNDGNKKVLHSYLRATYGGFIISYDAGIEEIIEMVQLCIEEAKRLDVSEIIVRNPFRIFNENTCDESDYSMWFHGFNIKYRELEIAIQVGNSDFIIGNYADSTRRSINKGKKVVIMEESSNYEAYWQMLEKNLSEKHGARPTHDFEQFSALLKNVGSEKIKLFVGKIDEKIIAGILVFIVNKQGIHAQYIASDLDYQDHRPLNVVIDHILHWASSKGYKYLNLGMANEDNGTKLNYGLFRFKEGFGGRGVLRETMHLQLK